VRKLHIGCGRAYFPRENGWVNHDVFESTTADIYSDMTRLPFDREYFDLIYVSHVLEHQHRRMILATLSHWHSLLARGGVLRIAVPDFAAVCKRYTETGNLKEVMGLLYGGQNHPKNFHTVAFDEATLTDALMKVGFVSVRHWNWWETEHAKFDDYSQAVLPHMDPNGMSVSLNMEATR
jgi:predicted SAM-dependent methyltransferase